LYCTWFYAPGSGLLEVFSKLVSDLKEAIRNFILDLFTKRHPKIGKKPSALILKALF
jgi:hypothetical protein